MKKRRTTPVWRAAAGCMAAVVALGIVPWTALTVQAEEELKLVYQNALDSMEGLVLSGANDSKAEIVQQDDRTALKMQGREGQAFLIDQNANAPDAGVIRFDMKINEVDDGVGGKSMKGGLLFGASEASETGPAEYMWFGAQGAGQLRIRHNDPSQDIITGGEYVKAGEWQSWQLEYSGDQLKILVDGQVQYEGKTPGGAQTLEGNAGFTAWSSYETYFDNLEILTKEPSQPEPSPSPEPTQQPEFRYENSLDTKDGLAAIFHPNAVEGQQQWDIVQDGERTVLKLSTNADNPGDFYVIDRNAVLPENAVVEFDMKLTKTDNGAGGYSVNGGFVFDASMSPQADQLEKQTWFAAQWFDTFRIRTTGQSDITVPSQNVKPDTYQHWRLEYCGAQLTVYIDGQKVYDGTLPGGQSAKGGLAGFMVWSASTVWIDNFVATEYETLPPPDFGSDEDLENAQAIASEELEVMVDKTFPQVLNYTLKQNGGKIFAGHPKTAHKAYITDDTATEGTAYDAEVTKFEATESGADYTLHIADFHGGLDVQYRIAVEGSEVVKSITGISGEGEPYLVSIRLDTPILRVKDSQNGAQLAHNTERSTDRFHNYQGDQDADVMGMLKDQNESEKLTDWAFLYTDEALGTAYNTLIDIPFKVQVASSTEGKYVSLYDREYYYRLAYYPNEDKDGEKHLGELVRYDTGEPFESRVLITGDANGNGAVDWQDGANWVRDQLPEISETLDAFMKQGGTWQQCHGTFPSSPTSSEVKIPYDVFAAEARKTYYMTDGVPQAYAIAGWQQHGHDWRWSDWDQPVSPGAGGYEAAKNAWDETKKYNSDISFHVNQEFSTPDSESNDPNIMARKADGSIQQGGSVWGQGNASLRSYFLDWAAGNTKARMDKFFDEQFWSPVILYNDQMWDMPSPYNGVYGIHESYAKKKIIQTYREHGVNVVTEGFQPTNLRNGLVQWKYHDMSSLISNYVIAGYGSAQMQSKDPYFQIFGAKVSSNARNGNIMTTLDFDKAIKDNYLYAAPTAYLRQFKALEYIDNSEMSAVRWSDNVMSKYIKATDSLEFTEDGVVILQGNDRFLPDLTTPESKIHVYSESGMAKEWTLPAYWQDNAAVDLYELTSNGQVYIERLPVVDGKVTPVCSAGVPYILVPASEQEIEPGALNIALDAESTVPNINDGDPKTVWEPETASGAVELDLGREREINRAEIKENGNCITAFTIEVFRNGEWTTVANGTGIGKEKIILFPSVLAEKVRFTVVDATDIPSISEIEVYADANLSLTATPSASSKKDYSRVYPDDRNVDVTYTYHADAYSAADASLFTMWQANGTENQTLEMSYNRTSKVNRVVLREQGDNVTSFKILGSKDGKWIELYEGTTIGEVKEINLPTMAVEKMRLQIVSAKQTPCIAEFETYGVDLVQEADIAKGNLALNKPAEQSSTYDNGWTVASASRAVDGNTNPDWSASSISATNEEVGAWWKVDLKDTYEIGAIKLFARNTCKERLADVDIMILDEAGEVVWSTHMKDAPDPFTVITVPQEDGTAVKGRYVKIQHTESIGARMLEIAECEVYESGSEIAKVDKTALQALYDGGYQRRQYCELAGRRERTEKAER